VVIYYPIAKFYFFVDQFLQNIIINIYGGFMEGLEGKERSFLHFVVLAIKK